MCRGKPFPYYMGLLLLFLHLQQTCASTNYYKQRCAPSSCGEISNISYPFRLKDHDPQNCGNPKYELACENNRTVLTLFSGKYFVKSIDYKNYRIRLVDPGIEDGDCSSIPRYSLSVFNFTSYYDSDYHGDPYQIFGRFIESYQEPVQVIYLKCSNLVVDDPRYADTPPCLNSHSTGGHLYAIAGYLPAGRLKRDCHVKLLAMTSSPAAQDDTHYQQLQPTQNLSYAQIHKLLIYGFNLSWMNGVCQDLNCPKDQPCYFNTTTWDLTCLPFSTFPYSYCTSPLGFGVRCEHLSKQRIFMEGDSE